MIDEFINNYCIVSEIGQGGMGTVYLAQHPFMGRKAAVKVLRKELTDDRGLVERFMNEARAAHAIGHPNIIDIIDVGITRSGVPYLMMEYLDGESLGRRLARERPLSIADALAITRQTSSALQAAHDKGIVHRDLKPDNLYLVRGTGAGAPGTRLKVLDFGIAKLRGNLTGSSPNTSDGHIMGTPPYMSPEQCRGIASAIDHRTDIYALGIILYEMLTGAAPFRSEGWGEVVIMHVSMAPPPIRPKNPLVSAGLEAVVMKALEKNPADRWTSMAELEEALRLLPRTSSTMLAAPSAVPLPRGAEPAPLPTTLGTAARESVGALDSESARSGSRGLRKVIIGAVGTAIAIGAVVVLDTHRGANAPVPSAPVTAAPSPQRRRRSPRRPPRSRRRRARARRRPRRPSL